MTVATTQSVWSNSGPSTRGCTDFRGDHHDNSPNDGSGHTFWPSEQRCSLMHDLDDAHAVLLCHGHGGLYLWGELLNGIFFWEGHSAKTYDRQISR